MNELFYRHYADAFHSTRGYGWRGWRSLLDDLAHHPSRVLDIGCGGGRFADFLQRIWVDEQGGVLDSYMGLERSKELLGIAQERSLGFYCQWFSFDWSSALIEGERVKFESNWVVLFGVMHHIYSFEARVALVVWAARHLSLDGFISISLWDFGASERYEKKYLPWDQSLSKYSELSSDLIEPGDRLLGWAGESHTPRYCHWMSASEEVAWLEEIAKSAPQLSSPHLTTIEGDMNRYWSWRLLAPIDPT